MNIHEHMLCRWVGYDIENPKHVNKPAPRRMPLTINGGLSDAQIERYGQYLRDALDPNKGLFVSNSLINETAGQGRPLSTPRECMYLTELAVSDASVHWRLYGRLGFVLSKRFIFNQGGRPVIYTKSSRDPVIKSVNTLRSYLVDAPFKEKVALELLASFVKTTSMPPITERKAPKDRAVKKKPKLVEPAHKFHSSPYSFPVQKPIRFLSEREWRLLRPAGNSKKWRENDGKLWFAPQLGTELQLLIVPNNSMVNAIYDSPSFSSVMKEISRHGVQILSLETLARL